MCSEALPPPNYAPPSPADRAKEFEALNCQVIAASTDTEECHLAWIRTPRSRGGLGYMQVWIVY